MEGCNGHPLQALADAITIAEFKRLTAQSCIVLGSASQSITTRVANLFVEMMQLQDADFVLHIQRVMN
jgi:N-succinyl-L-ornithine transcarbamylase